MLPSGDVGHNLNVDDRLRDSLKAHKSSFIRSTLDDPLLMEDRRNCIVKDPLTLIRYSQEDLNNPLQISFSNEDGVDLGGLRREFWSLFLHQLSHSYYMSGSSGRLFFQSNFLEKKKRSFFFLGQLVALSILQDGPGIPVFSDVVTDYILNREMSILNPTDLTETLQEILQKMKDCTSDEDVQAQYATIVDLAMEAGFLVPVSRFKKGLVNSLQAAFIENQVTASKEEMDQFIKGLDTHQVHSLLCLDDNRLAARALFSGRVKPVTATTLRGLLKFRYKDGITMPQQMETAQGFLTFIQASKGKETSVNGINVEPKDVLMWLTGSTHIPAIGFHKAIDVEFGDETFVNTCALCLRLQLQQNLPTENAVLHYTEMIINSQTFTKE